MMDLRAQMGFARQFAIPIVVMPGQLDHMPVAPPNGRLRRLRQITSSRPAQNIRIFDIEINGQSIKIFLLCRQLTPDPVTVDSPTAQRNPGKEKNQ